MLDLRVLLHVLRAMKPALRDFHGPAWPLAVARAAPLAYRLVRRSRWSGPLDDEARAVRALAILPAACLDARRRFPSRADAFGRDLVEAVVGAAYRRPAMADGLLAIADSRARWHAFFDKVVARGLGALDGAECLTAEPTLYHVRFSRCVFADAMRELGAPDLGRFACDARARFCSTLLPAFVFDRGESPTIAQGGSSCQYVWRPVDSDGHPVRPPAPGGCSSHGVVDAPSRSAEPLDAGTTGEGPAPLAG